MNSSEYSKRYRNKLREAGLLEEKYLRDNLSKLGISLKEFLDMVDAQGNRCAICGNRPDLSHPQKRYRRLHVDHDHKTNTVRRLLCQHCNLMLGEARDNPAILRAGAEYLEARSQ